MFPKGGQLTLLFTAVVEQDEDEFLAYIPCWDDVYAPGATPDEAMTNLMRTVVVVSLSYIKRGKPIPVACQIGRPTHPGRVVERREIAVPIEPADEEFTYA
jgi:predicted RNase H-like HicB family nuclease